VQHVGPKILRMLLLGLLLNHDKAEEELDFLVTFLAENTKANVNKCRKNIRQSKIIAFQIELPIFLFKLFIDFPFEFWQELLKQFFNFISILNLCFLSISVYKVESGGLTIVKNNL
jgi:hypothetical protein